MKKNVSISLSSLLTEIIKNSVADVQEDQQSKNIAYQWHQEKQANKPMQTYTCH